MALGRIRQAVATGLRVGGDGRCLPLRAPLKVAWPLRSWFCCIAWVDALLGADIGPARC